MTILITGGAGYLGTMLTDILLQEGYYIKVIDNFIYNNEECINTFLSNPNYEIIKGNILEEKKIKKTMKDIEIIIHLAALVGENVCKNNEELCRDINYIATKKIAKLCIDKYDINRFFFPSTCSVYGHTSLGNEESKVNPLDLYSETKLLAEKALLDLSHKGLPVYIFRFPTLYGISYRMRFDLVVNLFVMQSLINKKITVYGGNQWRPFLHIFDAAQSIAESLKINRTKLNGELFCIGSNKENYNLINVAKKIKKVIPDTKILINQDIKDPRSYKIDFNKCHNVLNFEPKYDLKIGIKEIKKHIQNKSIKNVQSQIYYNKLS